MANIPLPRPDPRERLQSVIINTGTRLPEYSDFRQAPIDDRRETSGYMEAILSTLADRMGIRDAKEIYNNGFQSYADNRMAKMKDLMKTITPGPVTPLGLEAGIDDMRKPGRVPYPAGDPMNEHDPAEELTYQHIDNPMGDKY